MYNNSNGWIKSTQVRKPKKKKDNWASKVMMMMKFFHHHLHLGDDCPNEILEIKLILRMVVVQYVSFHFNAFFN